MSLKNLKPLISLHIFRWWM